MRLSSVVSLIVIFIRTLTIRALVVSNVQCASQQVHFYDLRHTAYSAHVAHYAHYTTCNMQYVK